MAGSLNKVLLIGNVGRDPELRYTPNGKPVVSFTVATNRVWTGPDGERREETEWFNVVAWNRLAEQCNEYVRKGRKVYVEGRLHTRSWEGQDGQRRYRTEVIATDVRLLDRRPAESVPEDTFAAEEPEPAEDHEELPF
mgnify:FL=1|jgi:single-strand DNA-binding protein